MDVKYEDVTVRLSGIDGNANAIIAAVSRGIKRKHGVEAAEEYRVEARKSLSYDALLQHAMRMVNTE